MAEVSWLQVVVGAATILGTALKLPAVRLDWGEEHRIVSRIQRHKAVLDAVGHPSVKRLLDHENEWLALNLVARQMLPYKLRLRLSIHLVWIGYLGSVAAVVCSLVFHRGWGYFALAIFALLFVYFLSYPVSHRYLLHQANRRAYVFSGAPKNFRVATRAMVPRQGDQKKRRNIYVEFAARMNASEPKPKGLSLDEYAPEAYAIWTQILDEQKAMWHERGQELRELLREVNKRKPKPALFQKLDSRLERTQERLESGADDEREP